MARHDYTDADAMAINDRILQTLVARGIAKYGNVRDYARACSMDGCVVYEIHKGITRSPSVYQLIRLARGLGMKVVITKVREEKKHERDDHRSGETDGERAPAV